jgi:hypothetical protein
VAVVAIGRGRFGSLVLAAALAHAAVAIGAAGCNSDNNQAAGPGPGGNTGRGGAPSVGRGGAAGSAVGGSGIGGASGSGVAGAGGAVGGGGGATGCTPPAGPAGSWVEVTPPPGQSGFRATDAFAVGTDDLMFAGNTFDSITPATDARVLRWSQGCWTVELMIAPSTPTPQFPSVNGTGPNDVWAVGGDLLYHRDAQGWTRFSDESWRGKVRPPASFAGPIELRRVRAVAANDIWVAATNNILHWSGGQWTTYNFDDPDYPNVSASIGFYFRDIWIDSPSSVWVAGPSDQVGNTMDLAVMHHFDGASFTHTVVPLFSLEAIWRGGSVLWLTGATRADINGVTQDLTLSRFDGTTATAAPIAGVDPTQRSIFMTSLFGHGAGDIWAGGNDVAHFDRQGWSLVPDAPAAARSDLDLSNTFVAGDAGSVWLATPGPRFFRKVTGP